MKNFEYTSFYIDYKGYKIQCYKIGKGEKILLSFPGFPHSGLSYTFFTNFHPIDSHTIITFDLPGWIGYSENIFENSQYSSHETVEIAREVLRSENIHKVDIIGYSFGGSIAVLFASKYLAMVNKIILVSTILNSNLLRFSKRNIQIKMLKKINKSIILKKIVLNRFKHVKQLLDESGIPIILEDRYKDMLNRIDGKVLLDSVYELFSNDYSKELIKIKNKDIAIVNSRSESAMFKKQAHYIRELLPKNTSLYLNGSHDAFLLRSKNAPVKSIIKFLEKK